MAVIFYDEGEHDTGFVGFRVATTLGSNESYHQKYYSLKDYSYATARKLAYAQDAEWRAEAESIAHFGKLHRRKRHWGKNIIVEGLRAYIGIENKIRNGEKRTYFSPAFRVKQPGYNKGDIVFRTSVYGYQKAYKLAVDEYCRTHGFEKDIQTELLELIPCETVFTEYLFEKLKARGHELCKYDLMEKLI